MKRMDWIKLLSKKRLGKESESISEKPWLNEFERDINRVIFSGPFRRMSRKTQVHPLVANDYVHTRLTHCLEVARLGKALGKALGYKINPDIEPKYSAYDIGSIVEAACLAHDIGNPPFGHAGEEAMIHWFEINGPSIFENLSRDHRRDLINYDGNAQGFRVITQTEDHLFQGGLRLTYSTLSTFVKYPWTSRKDIRKCSIYISEEQIFNRIADELGIIQKGMHEWCRHPLSYLLEAADDICYCIIDLEDAVELKIIPFELVESLLLKPFDSAMKKRIKKGLTENQSYRVNLARIRGPVIDLLVGGAIDGFMNGYEKIMTGEEVGDVFKLLDVNDGRRKLVENAKQIARENVFPDLKKVEIELGSYSVMETLLESFCYAALECSKHMKSPKGESYLSWKSELVLKLLGNHMPSENNAPPGTVWSPYQCLRRVIDVIGGMTDNYATYISGQLRGMGFSGVQRP